jgi:hypothetical protein
MSYGRLRRIIRRLRLWHVDDRTRHGTNEDYAAWYFSLHKVLGHTRCEQISAVNVDTPEFLHPVIWIVDRVVVLSEARTGYEDVYLAVRFDDFFNAVRHRRGRANVAEMGRYFGDAVVVCVRFGLLVWLTTCSDCLRECQGVGVLLCGIVGFFA